MLDRQFDMILCIAAFHHLETEEDRLRGLRAMARSLPKHGYFAMTNWNLLSPMNIARYGNSRDEKGVWNIKIGS